MKLLRAIFGFTILLAVTAWALSSSGAVDDESLPGKVVGVLVWLLPPVVVMELLIVWPSWRRREEGTDPTEERPPWMDN